MSKKHLETAKKNKNDEFYTRYEDIEKELIHYKPFFKNKIVYTNCDNPNISNFYNFFVDNFDNFGLKRIICTCLGGGVVVYDKTNEHTTLPLYGDCSGSYDNYQWFIDMCDIIVTNPPFSIFREYYKKIHNKDFLIIGNQCVFKSNVIFDDIWNGRVRCGYNNINKYIMGVDGYDKKAGDEVNVGNGVWLTTLPVIRPFFKFQKKDTLLREYDNYYAANVDSEKDIPENYRGIIGVPISFLKKLNTEQFKIVGMSSKFGGKHILKENAKTFDPILDGKVKFLRLFIQKIT